MEETLYTPSPPGLKLPFSSLPHCFESPSLPVSLLSIHFLITPPSPVVDLHPPPPNSTQLFSFWVISIPVMFIHDWGSEREIRSQVLSRPWGLWGLQVNLNKHTQTNTHSLHAPKKAPTVCTHTNTQTCLENTCLRTCWMKNTCANTATNTRWFWFLGTYKQRCFVHETLLSSSDWDWANCLSSVFLLVKEKIFFYRDVITKTCLTLICQQCLSWCHDTHTTREVRRMCFFSKTTSHA